MKQTRNHSWLLAVSALSATLCGIGCSGAGAPPPPPAITVSVVPAGAQTVDQGQTKSFTANVGNDSSNKGVSWSLTQNGASCSPGCGTISPTTTPSGQPTTYTAPAAVNSTLQFNVTATSVADTTKSTSESTAAVPPPAVSSPAQLPGSSAGQAYSYTLTESGGVPPYTWSIVSGSLPPGLSLSSSTGVISGTLAASPAQGTPARPMSAGTPTPVTYSFTVKVVDSGSPPLSAQAATAISNTPSPLKVTTSSLPNGTVGAAYSQPLAATGGTGAYAWSLQNGSALPAGLSLNPSGVISGTPTGPGGTFNFTIQVTDSAASPQTATGALSIQIIAQLSISTTTLPGGVIGSAYIQSLAATGGTTPYTWSISAGSLPPGLLLNSSTGAITGTPTGPAGTASFTAKVIDSGSPSQSVTANLSISVANASPVTVNLQPTNPSLDLAQGISVDFFALVTGDPANAGVTWALQQNQSSCSPGCGTLTPGAKVVNGSSGVAFPATYTPPSGGLLAGGLSLLVTATSVNGNPKGSANAGLSVSSCNSFQDILCGQINFYVQGFDQNGKPAAAAGSFTATGIPAGTPPNTSVSGIVCGVMDLNDVAGADSPAPNTSGNPTCAGSSQSNLTGSYTFDPATFTGTFTVNINSNISSKPPTHAQRTYAFTAGTGGSYPLIEFEPSGSPAFGLQGSGFISPMGPTAFSTLPPSTNNTNYEFGFVGNDSAGLRTGLVGSFIVDKSCNFLAFPAGTPPTVTSNQNGNLQYGSLATAPNTPCTKPDSITGRSTVALNYTGQANVVGNLAFYPSGLRDLVFLSTQPIASSPLLMGLAHSYSVPTTSATSNGLFSCGLSIVSGLPDNCLAYASGASGSSVTLTLLDQITQPATNPTGQPAWTLSGNTLTSTWRATEDQVASGTLTSTAAPTAGSYNFSYIFDTASGAGNICLFAAPCVRNPLTTPTGGMEFASSFGSGGFLLSLDNTVALGAIEGQFFLCPQLNCAPSSLQTILPGSYAAGTILPALPKVPNSTGIFNFSGNAAQNPPCPTTTLPATLAGPLALTANAEASVTGLAAPIALANLSGSYCTDNTAGDGMTGWGNGFEFNVAGATHPAPPQFDLLLDSGGVAGGAKGFLMETDNAAYPGGQMLMELLSQCAGCFALAASPSLLSVPQGGQSQTAVTVRAIGPSSVAVNLTTAPFPNGLTGCFYLLGSAACTVAAASTTPSISIPSGNGTAILVLFATPTATLSTNNSVGISASNNATSLSVNVIP